MLKNLIIVSNRLPISVARVKNKLEFYPSIGGLATGLAGYAKMKNSKWIGWPGIASDDLTQAEKDLITTKLGKNNCYPVFLTQKQLDGFYNGYSNSILWPLFHNLEITPENMKKQDIFWDEYKKVNAIFADAVLTLCDNKSNIWVHDYHLLLLPSLLRQKHIDDRIGFFLHIPFPALNNFLKISNAIDLTLGVLGADLVGFHTHGYANNFTENCKFQNIGLLTKDCIALHDRIIRMTNFPMGIDYGRFIKILEQKNTEKEILRLQSKYKDKKVILTVDRLEPSKGLIERVTAYRDFLRRNNQQIENVVMTMLVVPSRTQIEVYEQLRIKLEDLINKVNAEFETSTWKPIEYMFTCLPLVKLTALYQRADIAFIVPAKDGMNLVSKEFIACKTNDDGVLILSKKAGAAEQLHDAILVDPSDTMSSVKALERAISMPMHEKKRRLMNLKKLVSTYTVQYWANNFLLSLLKSPILPTIKTKKLSLNWQDELVKEYSIALKRVLMFGYDGTLTPLADKPEYAVPKPKLVNKLKELTTHKTNQIVIISSRDKNSIGEWFKDVPITLIVEHGGFVRKAKSTDWELENSIDSSWKPTIATVLESYVVNVPNSFIEKKDNSLTWNYRTAKPYYVNKYIPSLIKLLEPLIQKLGLRVEHKNARLEIWPASINKGNSAMKYSKRADFVMAIGDDSSDEEMFLALSPTAWTIKVGPGPTFAKYRVNNVDEVHNLLDRLNGQNG